ncbi:MAG: PepSY-associated TM helix domain-containing protein, partial [Bacteroidota bacterium]
MADKRDYNVFFDTHTVSGIVISTGLYMIFLAGAFALFMENINHWEANEPVRDAAAYIDYDGVLEHLEIMGYDMHGRTVRIRNDQGKIQVFSLPLTNKSLHSNPSAILSDSLAKGSIRLHLESQTFAEVKMIPVDRFKKLGGFLYGLHYFHPIPYGMELSGIVAAIFLFSIITGLIIHWKKIVSNFFTFRLKSTIKNLWADAHSALGIIGLPYQFMFALTGAFLGFHLIFLNPVATMYYGNSIHEVYKDVFPSFSNNKDFAPHGHSDEHVSVNSLVNNTLVEIGDRDISYMDVVVKNYKDENAH